MGAPAPVAGAHKLDEYVRLEIGRPHPRKNAPGIGRAHIVLELV